MSQEIPHFDLPDDAQIRVSRLEEKHTSKYFPTHRHKYYELVIITSTVAGDFSHDIDFKTYPLVGGRVYFIAPSQAHTWNIKSYNKEYKGLLVTFNDAFIHTGNQTLENQLLKLFDPLDTKPYIEFDQQLFHKTFPTLSILEEEYNKKHPDFFVLRALLETLIHYMAKRKSPRTPRNNKDCHRIVDLRIAIEKYFREEKHVEFYARHLDLSTKRLNEICKELTGETVTKILHQRLLLEAKREMISGVKNIQTISDELGFENPSYFARFFKKLEGKSPSEFSNSMFK